MFPILKNSEFVRELSKTAHKTLSDRNKSDGVPTDSVPLAFYKLSNGRLLFNFYGSSHILRNLISRFY
ncbi:hypothetical protein CH380_17335 [Leptospira adleri]|uniref:Uncharacterized protein n=1 Tax=Leptospira adleri TaxID=2023186 RepID=A0A2M9YKD0_9LEPT|nr:hypothetical protein CH380_17335 [Leptospira adleri]PJZ59607.1 hypothetical protein CH376_22775 [Leptospira adleri]